MCELYVKRPPIHDTFLIDSTNPFILTLKMMYLYNNQNTSTLHHIVQQEQSKFSSAGLQIQCTCHKYSIIVAISIISLSTISKNHKHSPTHIIHQLNLNTLQPMHRAAAAHIHQVAN